MNSSITGLVLAGGLGRRMGGVDKGLQLLQGRPMVEHVIARLRPQVDAIVINANQNLERYAEFGCPLVPDEIGGFAGPLAGLHAGLKAATSPFVVTAPCDSPFLPTDLVARLAAARAETDADLAVAKTGEQTHPVFALVATRVLPDLTAYLAGGDRKVDLWFNRIKTVEVPFEDEAAFYNINTRAELAQHDRS